MTTPELITLYIIASISFAGLAAYLSGRLGAGSDAAPIVAATLVAWPIWLPIAAFVFGACALVRLGERHAKISGKTA